MCKVRDERREVTAVIDGKPMKFSSFYEALAHQERVEAAEGKRAAA